MRLDDPDLVRREYASENRLRPRKRAQKELRQGVAAEDVIVAAVAEVSPIRVFEVGFGLGELAERIESELRCRVIAGRGLAERSEELRVPFRARSDQAVFVAAKAA